MRDDRAFGSPVASRRSKKTVTPCIEVCAPRFAPIPMTYVTLPLMPTAGKAVSGQFHDLEVVEAIDKPVLLRQCIDVRDRRAGNEPQHVVLGIRPSESVPRFG